MTICANKDASLNLINSFMLLDANGVSNSPHAIYFCSNNKLNLTESTLEIKNYPQDALEWDGGDGGYNVNLTKSIYISDNNRSGFTGTFVVTVSDQSRVQVLNSRGNGSNGSHFIVENKSIVDFINNGSHGLSAGNLTIKDSTVTATDNKFCGIVVSGKFNIFDHSIVTVDSNASGKSNAAYAGFRLSGSGESTIDSTSSLSIKNNQNTGLYVRAGDLTISEGANVEITNNTVTNNIMGGFGGGIYVGYEDYSDSKVILPSNAKIYNNHAPVAGDDIYNANGATITNLPSVGTDWILDDCNDLIDGWYDDSAKVDGEPNTGRWEMHDETQRHILPFTESTISEVTALKAAHGIPTPPVDPEDPTPTPDPDPDPTPRPGGGGDEDDDTPTIINETPVPTTTIDDEDVPLTDLPEDTVTIDDEEVPLKDIPNTGDMIPVPAMVAAVISIGGIALLMKKHK